MSKMVLVIEYAGRGSLDRWICHYELAWDVHGRSVACDVSRGMAYLHGRKPALIHRDIKSANIFLTANFTAKVADFGETKALRAREGGDDQSSVQMGLATVREFLSEFLSESKVDILK